MPLAHRRLLAVGLLVHPPACGSGSAPYLVWYQAGSGPYYGSLLSGLPENSPLAPAPPLRPGKKANSANIV